MTNDVTRRMAAVLDDLDSSAARLLRVQRLLDGREVVDGLECVLGGDGFVCSRVLDTRAVQVVWVAWRTSDGARFEANSPLALVRAVDAWLFGSGTPAR